MTENIPFWFWFAAFYVVLVFSCQHPCASHHVLGVVPDLDRDPGFDPGSGLNPDDAALHDYLDD